MDEMVGIGGGPVASWPVHALASPLTHTAYIDHIGEGVGALLVERRQNER